MPFGSMIATKFHLQVVEDDYSGFKPLSATLAVDVMALVLRVAQ